MIAAAPAPRPTGNCRALVAAETGAVMIEFLLAFPPILVLFLGLTQLALLAAADLVVRHAAIAGVRAAVVVLDDDPRHYDGAPRGHIHGGANGAGLDQRFASQLGARAGDWPAHANEDGPRMAAIRTAVHAPLTAIAPSAALLAWPGRPNVDMAIGGAVSRVIAGLADFIPTGTAIVFPSARGSAELQHHQVTADPVVLRVTHLVPCAIPLARMLLCRALGWDAQAKRLAIAGADELTRRALEELKRAPGAAGQATLAQRGMWLAVVTVEASLPLQGAPYAYVGERSEP